MSIFPKRITPGETVTIHWNFNTANLIDFHVLPWVKIGVRSPHEKVTILFEDHVLGLPDEPKDLKTEEPRLKYLNKNVPLLLLADYLSGKHKKEKLIEILENIQSGRHYYFSYKVPENAPLGKYKLISEMYINGELKFSKTAADDFFLVEKVLFKGMYRSGNKNKAVIVNHSPETTPVKIVGCTPLDSGKIKTTVNVFEIEALEEKRVRLYAPLNFLLYNEERKVTPLQEGSRDYLLRNQQVLELNKNDGNIYLLKKHSEEGYQLTEPAKALWRKSDGLLNKNNLSAQELEAYHELMAEGLIKEISF